MTTTNTQSTEKTFFNSNLSGFAYLQRAREVQPKKGNPYMAVTVAIQQGKAGETNSLYVDCNVVGEEATALVRKYQDQINDRETRVGARAISSDLYVDPFIYKEGHPKAGQPGASLKGRLLKLTAMKINGQLVPELVQASVEFGHEHWPLTENVRISSDDSNAQLKAAKLQQLGYIFNQGAGCFVLGSDAAKEQLTIRQNSFNQLPAAQAAQQVVNG